MEAKELRVTCSASDLVLQSFFQIRSWLLDFYIHFAFLLFFFFSVEILSALHFHPLLHYYLLFPLTKLYFIYSHLPSVFHIGEVWLLHLRKRHLCSLACLTFCFFQVVPVLKYLCGRRNALCLTSLSPTLKKFDELTKTLVCETISLDILLTGTREDAGPLFFLSSSKRESLQLEASDIESQNP